MTREEEIKARLDSYSATYYHPLTGSSDAEPDMLYLLARNEELTEKYRSALDRIADLECAYGNCLRVNQELQREKDKMRAVGRALYLTSRNHPDWPGCRIVDAEKLKPFKPDWVGSEDAKEQDDAKL